MASISNLPPVLLHFSNPSPGFQLGDPAFVVVEGQERQEKWARNIFGLYDEGVGKFQTDIVPFPLGVNEVTQLGGTAEVVRATCMRCLERKTELASCEWVRGRWETPVRQTEECKAER